jgi:nucleoside phosphorylase
MTDRRLRPLPGTTSSTWSFAQARQAAAQVRAAPLARQALATIRPRGVVGLVRSHAPLALLLFVAARDGLVTEQDGGGFAVLRRPAISPPVRSGGRWLRLLRWLDRQWDFALFAIPPSLGVLGAAITAITDPRGGGRIVALFAAVAVMAWICVFLTGTVAYQLRWVARLGAPSAPGRDRAAESLPGYHWSVPLVHQPDPDRADELIRLLTGHLTELMRADLQESMGDKARIGLPDVTETLVVLTGGITTEAARTAMAASLRAIRDYPAEGGMIVLASAGRLERVPRRPVARGGFLLLYVSGLAAVIAVCARLVAAAEARACLAASCAGHPTTYTLALRWLLQRLLFSDPPGLSPGTAQDALLGWLVSAAAAMFIVVFLVAAQQEIARNRQAVIRHDERLGLVTAAGRVLILVVTSAERDAVLHSVGERVGQDAVVNFLGRQAVYTLGSVAGAQLMLAQAGEQGTATAAGMFLTASEVIEQCRPDYVILTGICFGLRPDEGQQAGDIVVARRVHNIDPRKVTDDIDRPVIHRGVNVGCSPGLLSSVQAAQSSWPGARVHIGTVLTSSMLVNSERVVQQLRHDFPDAIAGEMEGAGVHEAATLGMKPDWIMVKAISDWGHGKTDHAQSSAAQNAADFVTYVVASGALRRPRDGSRL